jgi:tetraacyldisaccharide 4'-kinase
MPRWLSFLLIPFSWLYGLVVLVRNYLYKSGVYTRSRFDFPIICVGNISAGGTGKTPHIEWLIKKLSEQYRVAVLSRGYKRKTRGYLLATPAHTPSDIGDEPFQVKQKFKDIPVAVSENRVLGIPSLLAEAPETQVVLMDDGFQHLSIKAGFNIVLCDYNRPYYNDRLLPAGLLRESSRGAQRADVIIVTKCPASLDKAEQDKIREQLRPQQGQHVFFSTIVYGEMKPLTQAAQESAYLPHDGKPANFKRAVAVAGIARPQPFVNEVSRYFEQTDALVFPDHATYDPEKISLIRGKAAIPNTVVITTEKDAVKLMDRDILTQINQVPVWYLPVSIAIMNNEESKLLELLNSYIERETREAAEY